MERAEPLERLLWDSLLLLCLSTAFQWDVCKSQRVIDIQKGPLYRVAGYSLDISCNVSNVGSSNAQDFEFSIYEPANPNQEIKIISTKDHNFAYAKYSRRLQTNDIQIKRESGFSVVFHINTTRLSDEGEYECSTPSPDGTYFGMYSAKTRIQIIQETLSTSCDDTDLSKTEGESLTLDCDVSTQTFQHTHLSVTWYLQRGGDIQPRPIILLDWDLTVKPGDGFGDRYHSGLVSLHKVGGTTYRLILSKVQVTDQGTISCEGSEWIQDPDHSWYRMAYKKSRGTKLQIQPLILDPDIFAVRLETPKGGVREGELVKMKCTVEAQELSNRYFTIAWLLNGKTVANVGPTGVPTVSKNYETREHEGEINVVKKSDRDYVLFFRPIRMEDQGEYQCKIWKEEKGEGGTFIQGFSKSSKVENMVITVTETNLMVTAQNLTATAIQGSVLQITCKVTGAKGQVSITWQHMEDQGPFNNVISLNHNGIMETPARFQQRMETGDLWVYRVTANSFTLKIANAQPSDSGIYKCIASDWVSDGKGNFKKVDSKSLQFKTNVQSMESLVDVSLRSRKVKAMENETLELICKVRRPSVPLSVTWTFQHENTTTTEDIVSLLHTGDIRWSRESYKYQLGTEVQEEDTSFKLNLSRVSMSETGIYQCVIKTFLRNVQLSQKDSNPLRVIVTRPVSALSITMEPPSPLEITANSDILMGCRILSATSNSSNFAVSWLIHRNEEGNRMVLSMTHNSVTSGLERGTRYSLRRREARLYELEVRQAEPADSGLYHCQVEEWLQDPHGVWYTLSSKSESRELIVKHKQSEFRLVKNTLQILEEENQPVTINCTLAAGNANPVSHYSVIWYFTKVNSSAREQLVKFGPSGVLDSTNVTPMLRRMRFYRTALDTFSLTIQNISVHDSGNYTCKVNEYQPDSKNILLMRATDESGVTTVAVQSKAPKTSSSSFGELPQLIGLLALVILLTIVIVILSYKLHNKSAEMKMKKGSLWVENKPLQPQTEL